ncbi:MAG: 30S ribosomal protein S17 [Candidatus Latescibacteria bacterium]|nr:30S ribosomal protein S17 [Candidatus Latescibacterota bacterium]
MDQGRGHRKTRTGRVVSDKSDKTRIIIVERSFQHSLYEKTVRRRRKFAIHDEENRSKVGDLVSIMETRPLSKTKRWRLVEVLERAK